MAERKIVTLLLLLVTLVHSQQVDSTHKKGKSIFYYPLIFYTPETELAFGCGGIFTFRTSKNQGSNPSQIGSVSYYTTNQQYLITINPELYVKANRYYISAGIAYANLMDKFYGIGNHTRDIPDAAYYTSRFGLLLNIQRRALLAPIGNLFRNINFGLILDFASDRIADKKDNPYLLERQVRGTEGGITSGMGYTMVWDTRDNIFFPHSGSYHQWKHVFFCAPLGSDYDFNQYILDLRRYFPLAKDQVLGIQFYNNNTGGYPPFYRLPALGGGVLMRGYYQGRYRDQNYMMAQLEYRMIVWWRVGLAVFTATGDVAPQLRDFQLNEFKYSAGFGLRFVLDVIEKLDMRLDFGFGKKTSGVYVAIQEAF